MEHLADLETWTIAAAAGWKLLTFWWPLVVAAGGYFIYETYFMGAK